MMRSGIKGIGRVIALLCIVMSCVMCEEPVTPPSANDPTTSTLRVLAKDFNSVTIHFRQSADASKQAYRISYKAVQSDEAFDSEDFVPHEGSVTAGDFGANHPGEYLSVVVRNLTPQLYEFTLHIITESYETLPAYDTIRGAPATRHTMDSERFATPIRLYERGSARGACLIVHTDYAIPTISTVEDAPDGSVLFVLMVDDSTPKETAFVTTAELLASGIVEADIPSSKADLTTRFINYYALRHASILDSFEIRYKEFLQFATDPVHLYSVELLNLTSSTNRALEPRCFLIRFGSARTATSPSTFRWVRILIRTDGSGTLLQGTAPDRYIELELSVGHPGVPFA